MFNGFFDSTTAIGIVISLVVGFALKRWPTFQNKAIPIVTLAISILTQVLNALGHPAATTAGLVSMPVLTAGLFDSELFKVIVQAVTQWFLTTGAHSASKNTLALIEKK